MKGGSKTDAGINRIVTISPKIQPIIDRLTEGKEEGYIFCNESGEQLSLYTYRERFFYPSLEAAGIDNPADENGRKKYSPHSCRHTFANLIKGIDAADKDKVVFTQLNLLHLHQGPWRWQALFLLLLGREGLLRIRTFGRVGNGLRLFRRDPFE